MLMIPGVGKIQLLEWRGALVAAGETTKDTAILLQARNRMEERNDRRLRCSKLLLLVYFLKEQ